MDEKETERKVKIETNFGLIAHEESVKRQLLTEYEAVRRKMDACDERISELSKEIIALMKQA